MHEILKEERLEYEALIILAPNSTFVEVAFGIVHLNYIFYQENRLGLVFDSCKMKNEKRYSNKCTTKFAQVVSIFYAKFH